MPPRSRRPGTDISGTALTWALSDRLRQAGRTRLLSANLLVHGCRRPDPTRPDPTTHRQESPHVRNGAAASRGQQRAGRRRGVPGAVQGRRRDPGRAERAVLPQRTQPAYRLVTALLRGRRHDPHHRARRRQGSLVPQPLRTHAPVRAPRRVPLRPRLRRTKRTDRLPGHHGQHPPDRARGPALRPGGGRLPVRGDAGPGHDRAVHLRRSPADPDDRAPEDLPEHG